MLSGYRRYVSWCRGLWDKHEKNPAHCDEEGCDASAMTADISEQNRNTFLPSNCNLIKIELLLNNCLYNCFMQVKNTLLNTLIAITT